MQRATWLALKYVLNRSGHRLAAITEACNLCPSSAIVDFARGLLRSSIDELLLSSSVHLWSCV